MAKVCIYSIGPIKGQGRTKTEARKHAERDATVALQWIDQGPILIVAPPARPTTDDLVAILISPDTAGWEYRFLRKTGGSRVISSGYDNWALALYAAVTHASGNAIDKETTSAELDAIQAWIAEQLDEGQAVTERAGLAQRVRFYRHYSELQEQGMSASAAHRLAVETSTTNGGD